MSSSSVRVAVVGCGAWGKNLVRNFRDLGALGALCDSDPRALAAAGERAPGARAFSQLSQLLGDPAIDGIAIATPADTHAELAERALAAGHDVFCEKPLALSTKDASRLVALATDRGRILMVGHLLEYHPAIVEIGARLRRGDIGALRYIHATRLNFGRAPRAESVLWSLAPHDVAVASRLVGRAPSRVLATGQEYVEAGVCDVAAIHLEFGSGVWAHIFVSRLNPSKEQRLVVAGDRGMLTFDDVKKVLVRHEIVEGAEETIAERIEYSADEPLRRECEAFLSAMATRAAPLTDGKSALAVLGVVEAAERSARH